MSYYPVKSVTRAYAPPSEESRTYVLRRQPSGVYKFIPNCPTLFLALITDGVYDTVDKAELSTVESVNASSIMLKAGGYTLNLTVTSSLMSHTQEEGELRLKRVSDNVTVIALPLLPNAYIDRRQNLPMSTRYLDLEDDTEYKIETSDVLTYSAILKIIEF